LYEVKDFKRAAERNQIMKRLLLTILISTTVSALPPGAFNSLWESTAKEEETKPVTERPITQPTREKPDEVHFEKTRHFAGRDAEPVQVQL